MRSCIFVAPHGGAWIEIKIHWLALLLDGVAPHGGAWIEIRDIIVLVIATAESLPTGERGLKFLPYPEPENVYLVAPHGGAWIEIIIALY